MAPATTIVRTARKYIRMGTAAAVAVCVTSTSSAKSAVIQTASAVAAARPLRFFHSVLPPSPLQRSGAFSAATGRTQQSSRSVAIAAAGIASAALAAGLAVFTELRLSPPALNLAHSEAMHPTTDSDADPFDSSLLAIKSSADQVHLIGDSAAKAASKSDDVVLDLHSTWRSIAGLASVLPMPFLSAEASRIMLPQQLITPAEAARILTDAEATLAPPAQVAAATGVVRIDTNSVASNVPIEDYHTQRVVGSGLLVGVFDGHGGTECGRVLESYLLPYVAKAISASGAARSASNGSQTAFEDNESPVAKKRQAAIKDAITSAFVRLDDDIVNGAFTIRPPPPTSTGSDAKPIAAVASAPSVLSSMLFGAASPSRTEAIASLRTALSGACAIVAYFEGNDVYVASTGDSRAVVGRRITYASDSSSGSSADSDRIVYVPVALSRDQTASNLLELSRLEQEHPNETVISRGRVLGGLMPTRAFGDARYKWPLDLQLSLASNMHHDIMRRPPKNYRTPPYVTARPEVVHYSRDSNDAFLILATDGLWDRLSNQASVTVVGTQLETARRPSASSSESSAGMTNTATRLIISGLGSREDPARSTVTGDVGSFVPDFDEVRRLLSIPNGSSRRYRDDITVNVALFSPAVGGFAAPASSEKVPPADVSLANTKRHLMDLWRKIIEKPRSKL